MQAIASLVCQTIVWGREVAFTMLSKNFYAIISAVFHSKIDRVNSGYNTQLLRTIHYQRSSSASAGLILP